MSLLVVVFFLELALYLITTVGAKPINELLWQLWSRTPFGTSKDVQEQIRLRREVVRMKRELGGISAQDDFARWAKLRRQHDKAMEEHDKKAAAVGNARTSFDSKATMFRWTCTSGVKFALQFWHAKSPIYTYPREWFPWPIEFALGFPRCPYGGVSINVWSNSCGIVIALVGDVIMSVMQKSAQPQKEKVAMPARGPSSIPSAPDVD
ncbi:Protein GET1 [Cyphellophora attinorum]|uniref:Protein GET1 n=1 Tax=Cyphellophora attinorum TaxID=1664694 RepID=A0A0N1HDA3_9EURO|nr:Protein GET1 [Phialophora attinorum]KPI42920.1 Protein GET1 [Phialophora attinorum]